jgi:uncharacterized membrane protein YfcA
MVLHFAQALCLLFAAVIAGALNALAGGGSFISFPALLFMGIPAVEANATNTVALWPGLAASALAYLNRLNAPLRLLLPLQHTFLRLVPWLLLAGTLLFTFGNSIRAIVGGTAATAIDTDDADLRNPSWQAITLGSIAELLVAIYGGYFGAGIGFMMLAMLALMGMRDIHAMAAIRTLLAAAVNLAAVITFIVAHAVLWPQCAVMIAGSLAGGWFGAHYAQKANPAKVRWLVIGVGVAMTAFFFVAVR